MSSSPPVPWTEPSAAVPSLETGSGGASRWPDALRVLAGYTALALLYGVQLSIYRDSRDESSNLGDAFLTGAITWYGWAALTPLILAVSRWVRATGKPWPVQLVLHVPSGLLFAAAHLALFAGLSQLLLSSVGNGWSGAWTQFTWLLSKTTDFDLLIYLGVVGVDAALRSARKVREEAVRASRLEAQLAQAQLHLLRSQLRPHFLFNTLHAISTLMHRDVDAADRMVGQLSELLRASLERDGRHEIPLREELALLTPYLDIERTRFSDRLQVDVEVAVDIQDALVPPLLLQPLVENAIRHGIAPRRGPGQVLVRVERSGERLSLEVRDDGVGPPSTDTDGLREGIGLGSTRARLERLYGSGHTLTWGAQAPRGFVVSLSLPYRTARP